jgi:hypothetical protein
MNLRKQIEQIDACARLIDDVEARTTCSRNVPTRRRFGRCTLKTFRPEAADKSHLLRLRAHT